MPDFPAPAAVAGSKKTAPTGNYNYNDHIATANWITVTPGAGSYGSWVQVDASLSVDQFCVGLFCTKNNQTASTGGFLLDAGTGAAASEVTIAQMGGHVDAAQTGGPIEGFSVDYPYPIPITSTTRTALRMNHSGSANAWKAGIMMIDQADVVDF